MGGGDFSNQNQTPKSDKNLESNSSSSSNALDRSKNIRHRQKKLLSRYHRGDPRQKQPEIVYNNEAETVLKMVEHKVRVNTFLLDENHNNDQSTKATMSKNDVQVRKEIF